MRPPRALLLILLWIPLALFADTRATTAQQWLLGLATTALLVVLTMAQPSLVRWQVGIVVVFATVIELVFSGWLGSTSTDSVQCPRMCPPDTDWSISRRSISGSGAGRGATNDNWCASPSWWWCWSPRTRWPAIGTTRSAPSGRSACSDSCDGAARRCCSSGRSGSCPGSRCSAPAGRCGRGSPWTPSWDGSRWATRRRWQPAGTDGSTWWRSLSPGRWRCAFRRGAGAAAQRRGAGRWSSRPTWIPAPARRTNWSSSRRLRRSPEPARPCPTG